MGFFLQKVDYMTHLPVHNFTELRRVLMYKSFSSLIIRLVSLRDRLVQLTNVQMQKVVAEYLHSIAEYLYWYTTMSCRDCDLNKTENN